MSRYRSIQFDFGYGPCYQIQKRIGWKHIGFWYTLKYTFGGSEEFSWKELEKGPPVYVKVLNERTY